MHSSHLLFLQNLFSSDMLVIAFIALLLFGGEKLPELARGLGKGIRDFKDASEGVKREINAQINSFEEKRADEALDKQAVVQSQLPASTDAIPGTLPYVENTMPVNEGDLNTNETVEAGGNAENKATTITENHVQASHTEAGTN